MPVQGPYGQNGHGDWHREEIQQNPKPLFAYFDPPSNKQVQKEKAKRRKTQRRQHFSHAYHSRLTSACGAPEKARNAEAQASRTNALCLQDPFSMPRTKVNSK